MRLYKRNQRGEPQYWDIERKDKDICLRYGLVGGSGHVEHINPKLVKADEVASRIKAKRKEGYKELSELKDNGPETIEDRISLINYLNAYLPKHATTADGFVLPMLAKVLKDNKPFTKGSYLGQYKINGVRCIIGAQVSNDMFAPIKLRYWSREGTEWFNLGWMDDIILPNLSDDLVDAMIQEDVRLDGELYIPGQTVNNINSFVKNSSLPQHKLLQYWCYDILIENMSYNARRAFRVENIKRIPYIFDTFDTHINNKSQFVLLPDFNVGDLNNATRWRDKLISIGFEGLIIRNIDSEYQFGKRNSSMFKYKRVDDAKFKIIDIIPEGVRTNLCKLVLQNDINDNQFECTINAAHDYQEYVLKNKDKYIGKYAFVQYRERSGIASVPFHAKAIRIED